jgi:hypothetical protein
MIWFPFGFWIVHQQVGAMSIIRIHLHPVESEMLKEAQKTNPRYKDLETLLLGLIRVEYAKITKGRSSSGAS